MKKNNILFSSFRAKVTLALVLALCLAMGLSNFLIYRFSLNAQFNQLRDRLMVIAQIAALGVDADLLMRVPLSPEGTKTEEYKAVAKQLIKVKEAILSLKYIYTLAKTEQEGIWQFVVDPNPLSEEEKRKGLTNNPGNKYDVSRFPEMLKGFDAPSADRKLITDEWGVTLSGYAPVRDKNGKSVAVLGVDMIAEDVYITQRRTHQRAIFVLLLGILLSVALGLIISHKIAERIEKIVEGTRRIAADELDYKVEVRGEDEIRELADSFNRMGQSLLESRKKLQGYFYRVVQSLVRILEAKDFYTRGHSERVAEYAEKIALNMGFSQEKAGLIRKVGELHDIGKMAIHENILNKKEKLTDEEWKIIREHPVVGEDALKPVMLDEQMLAIIRSHHERYDGSGYPDKIKGDHINIFAQIISVADAYDAMTSNRAYRAALSKQEAIEELESKSGTQFNTEVVKAFIKILR